MCDYDIFEDYKCKVLYRNELIKGVQGFAYYILSLDDVNNWLDRCKLLGVQDKIMIDMQNNEYVEWVVVYCADIVEVTLCFKESVIMSSVTELVNYFKEYKEYVSTEKVITHLRFSQQIEHYELDYDFYQVLIHLTDSIYLENVDVNKLRVKEPDYIYGVGDWYKDSKLDLLDLCGDVSRIDVGYTKGCRMFFEYCRNAKNFLEFLYSLDSFLYFHKVKYNQYISLYVYTLFDSITLKDIQEYCLEQYNNLSDPNVKSMTRMAIMSRKFAKMCGSLTINERYTPYFNHLDYLDDINIDILISKYQSINLETLKRILAEYGIDLIVKCKYEPYLI